jgi:hypothetical protein
VFCCFFVGDPQTMWDKFFFFTTTFKFIRIVVIRYGAEPMQLRCGASQLSGWCSNRQSTVKVQGRESQVRGLVVLPGLPVSKGSPVRDERAPGLLSIPAPTDEEAVRANKSHQHLNPHKIHHLGTSVVPLACQVGGKPLLDIPGLASRNPVNQLYHRCKVLPHLQTGLKVFIHLLPLVLQKNFTKFFLLIGPGIRVRDTHIEYACPAAFPEPMVTHVTPFLGGCGWCWRCVCSRS